MVVAVNLNVRCLIPTTETYLELSQILTMELFAKKGFIVDVRLGSKYASATTSQKSKVHCKHFHGYFSSTL